MRQCCRLLTWHPCCADVSPDPPSVTYREAAAESVFKERCEAVIDGTSWAHYMAVSGSGADEYDIVSLQYTSDGLMAVDENREGRAAAFGDDIAIECAATELGREIWVVRGGDGGGDGNKRQMLGVAWLRGSIKHIIGTARLFWRDVFRE